MYVDQEMTLAIPVCQRCVNKTWLSRLAAHIKRTVLCSSILHATTAAMVPEEFTLGCGRHCECRNRGHCARAIAIAITLLPIRISMFGLFFPLFVLLSGQSPARCRPRHKKHVLSESCADAVAHLGHRLPRCFSMFDRLTPLGQTAVQL